ncbi:MAG: translation initiation factor IF-2 subunit alpha [archaeon]
MKLKAMPGVDDIVVVKIKRIANYGALADLLEYPGKEGFIHISKISSSWVKNIRSVVSEGQLRVAKVKAIDAQKGLIDLSLRDVSPQMEKRKNEDYKREKKADKIFEKICKDLKEDFKESYAKIALPLSAEFGDLFSAFENASVYGEDAFSGTNIPAKWKKAITEFARKSISSPEVEVDGTLILSSNAPDGIEAIKKSLAKAEGATIEYVSAPKYRLKVKAIDYETAEKKLKKIADAVVSEIKKLGGEGSFERKKEQ